MKANKFGIVALFSVLVLVGAGCSSISKVGLNTPAAPAAVNSANVNAPVVAGNTNTNKSVATAVDTSTWKTYTNSKFGFSFKYPSNWIIGSNQGSVVSVISPELNKAIKESAKTAKPEGDEPPIFSDLEVFVWSSASQTNNKYSGQPQYKNLSDLVKDPKLGFSNVNSVTVGSLPGFELSRNEFIQNYEIFLTGTKSEIYELSFDSISDKSGLDVTRQAILSAFKFGNVQPETSSVSSGSVMLLQDNKYKVRFVASKECNGYYSVTSGPETNPLMPKAEVIYDINILKSKQWPKGERQQGYAIYTPAEYAKFTPDELPGVPPVKFKLASGLLFIWWSPQDGPDDVPTGCGIDIQKF